MNSPVLNETPVASSSLTTTPSSSLSRYESQKLSTQERQDQKDKYSPRLVFNPCRTFPPNRNMYRLFRKVDDKDDDVKNDQPSIMKMFENQRLKQQKQNFYQETLHDEKLPQDVLSPSEKESSFRETPIQRLMSDSSLINDSPITERPTDMNHGMSRRTLGFRSTASGSSNTGSSSKKSTTAALFMRRPSPRDIGRQFERPLTRSVLRNAASNATSRNNLQESPIVDLTNC